MKIVLIVATMLLSGCGMWDRTLAHYTGDASETCHKGVMYLQFTSGASVKYERDGSISKCN